PDGKISPGELNSNNTIIISLSPKGTLIMVSRVRSRFESFLQYGPLTITVFYLVFGLIWIYFSDTFVFRITDGNNRFLELSTFKGFAFVLITALLLFAMIRFYIGKAEEEHERYRALAENFPDIIYHLSLPDGKYEYVNSASLDVIGYTPEEVMNTPLLLEEIVHPAWKEDFREKWKKLLAGEVLPSYEYQVIHKSGETRWVSQRTTLLRNDDGRLVAVEGEIADITERKLAEEMLKSSERQLTDILNFLPDATFAIDRLGKVIAWNHAIEQMTGIRAADILGKGDYEYAVPFYGDRRPVLIDLVSEELWKIGDRYTNVKREGDILVAEAFVPGTYQGKGADLWGIATPLYDTSGNVTGAIESIRDVRDRRMAEDALSQATKKLSLLNSIALTDIQNAVFSLSGYLELEKNLQMDEKLRRCLEKQTRIVRGISDSLLFTRNYQSLGLKPPAWQSVPHTFLFAISHLDLSNLARNLDAGELEIYADPLLENVFFTLAENVILHAGTATKISLWWREVPCGLILVFEDNGPGIPDDRKEKIFNRQYEEKRGMGLFLSREILSITGITIRETGDFGKGARFEILVPGRGYRSGRKNEGQGDPDAGSFPA
ncbi:MAG: PAS domain-containing sensor histidine kinase, partial [Methanoregulaceae archaeon]